MEGAYEMVKVQVLHMGNPQDGFEVLVMDMEGAEIARGTGSSRSSAREDTGLLTTKVRAA